MPERIHHLGIRGTIFRVSKGELVGFRGTELDSGQREALQKRPTEVGIAVGVTTPLSDA